MMPGEHHVTREILGNIPAEVAAGFYVVTFVALLGAGVVFARRIMKWRRGRRDPVVEGPRTSWRAGLWSVLEYLTFHRQLRRDRYAGSAHMLTFYGFFILFVGTCIVAAEDYGQKFFASGSTPGRPLFFYGWFYLLASLVIDLGGVAMIVGLVMFAVRRRASTTPTLPSRESSPGSGVGVQSTNHNDDFAAYDASGLSGGNRRVLHAWWVPTMGALLLAIGLTGFLLEGARIARDLPAFERWSVVGYVIAVGLRGVGIAEGASLPWHRALWISHAVLCVVFFALLPWRFFSHMVYGAVSWARRAGRPRAQLRMPVLQVANSAPGAARWQELGWLDLMQADACTTCGRCNAVCPASAAGKPLQPRDVVLGLRQAMDSSGGSASGGSASGGGGHAIDLTKLISDDVVWSCTTCGGGNHACPVGIEVYDKIVELRRGRVERGTVPDAAAAVFDASAARFNPFGKPAEDRMNWARDLAVPVAQDGEPVELLYWVGCAGSFDPEGRGVSRAMIKLLNHLKINFRVLGKKEFCTGDPARRMGEEGLFQQLARQNVAQLRSHSVTRVLTHCPHCFNTFKNEYPALGGSYQVEHHTQFLARMIAEGKLAPPEAMPSEPPEAADGDGQSVTFHDPCYLGRGNGETLAPRKVLASLPGAKVTEMARHGENSFCCGAGGGAMWLDVKGKDRVENLRVREAKATGAKTIATGCPFCKTMLQAGATAEAGPGEKAIEVKDLAELLAERL